MLRGSRRLGQLVGDKLAFKLFSILRRRAARERGFRGIVVPVDDLIGHYIMSTGRFEATQFDALEHLFQCTNLGVEARTGRFVDVGANIGLYSLALSENFISTLAIEANPQTMLVLRANLALLNKDSVIPACVGASSTTAEDEIHVPLDGNLGQATLNAGQHNIPTKVVPVSIKPLDDILKDNPGAPVALLKIDVEGHERQVLEGAAETLENDGPLVLFEALSGAAGKACAERLRHHGYSYFYCFKRDWPKGNNKIIRMWRGLCSGLPVAIELIDPENVPKAALVCASKSALV